MHTFPSAVQSWCIRCRERTEQHDQSSIFVDYTPRWTLGSKQYLLTGNILLPRTTRFDVTSIPKCTSGRIVLQRHKTTVDSSAIHQAHNHILTIQKQWSTQGKICIVFPLRHTTFWPSFTNLSADLTEKWGRSFWIVGQHHRSSRHQTRRWAMIWQAMSKV